jgi:prepilin-type processing-associated H-X9-DG protein
LSAVASPAKTVMIYEGKAGKLDYRHNGRAVVGFMDGHCKLINADEAAGLIWTVKVPQPARPIKKKAKR